MRKNMGTADRTIRALIGLGIGGLYLTGYLSGTVGLALLVAAAVFLATSAAGFCPAYVPFRISTCRRHSSASSGEGAPHP